MDASEFCRLMRVAWHELQTPVTVTTGYVRMLRKGRPDIVDAVDVRVDTVLARVEQQLQRIIRLVMALRELGEARTVVGAIDVCAAFVSGLVVEASDEARIVAAPLDEFAAHLLILMLSLQGSDTDAFKVSAEVLVTPEHCRVILGPADPPARNGLKEQPPAKIPGVHATVAALQKAACGVSFYENSSGTRLIELRWTRPLSNPHRAYDDSA